MGKHEQVARESDPLLAGLPQDPDFCVPCLFSTSAHSNMCVSAAGKCEQHWKTSRRGHAGAGEPGGAGELLGRPMEAPTSSDTPLDKISNSIVPWSKRFQTVGPPPATENTELGTDWQPSGVPRRQASGSPLSSHPEAQEHPHTPDVVKKTHGINKKPSDTSSSKGKGKSSLGIADAQKLLRCELESLKCQLHAQTKAFEFLNHSVTMLEKESCLQQTKIQQLEEMLNLPGHQLEKEGCRWGSEQGPQQLYEALAQGLRGLEKTLRDSEEVQRARTARCLQLLAQEIQDSKKFLWEELELVREEVTFIYQKLQAQEEEITENLANIQKMQKTQMKCRKVLSRMRREGCDVFKWPEEDMPMGGPGSWKSDLQKELSDIWCAVHMLQNSVDCASVPVGGRPRAMGLRGEASRGAAVTHTFTKECSRDHRKGLWRVHPLASSLRVRGGAGRDPRGWSAQETGLPHS
ncbi:coiled-coil domain-containing protein 159 isoform X2 [Sorex araneus]|uniref:coiled-coil domain-containing protein 159 isoform X2 n=1 Tax=Sorex araneus TaxID=42254 RepID=UPI0024338FB3|nr:coiled-coil domain-containing protein 159 isoform X2 [Sorex araneus]